MRMTRPKVRPVPKTIVFFRHGEKPSGGLGQLTCQGLNRRRHGPRMEQR